MSDALALPPRPNLERYKKLSKDFRQSCKSNDPGAIRQWAARWTETLVRLQGIEITAQVLYEIDSETKRIEQRWHDFKKSNKRAASCTLADAQFFIAREHGFANWPRFARHVEAMAGANTPVSRFEAAADAIISGKLAKLKKLLSANPELVRTRSTREHRSTLLHYVSANGIEDFRQKTPKNIVEIAKMLLDADADVNAESAAYGGGSTTLGLVATSIHPQRAGVQIALLETLLDHGAGMHQPSAAGNAQSVVRISLANGQPEAAKFLANRGAPVDLEAAAGLGRLSIVESYFDESAVLKPPATKQQMESSFLCACWYGNEQVVEFLLGKGVDPGSHNDGRQTGLHSAAYGAHVGVVKLLLERGSPVHVNDVRFHATPLDAALWVWNNSPDRAARERCYKVVALLARAGAKLDPKQWHDPENDRTSMLEKIGSDPQMLTALRGETSS